MYKCPHCNQPGVTKLRKACLGPALPTKCQACGGKVGVPYGPSIMALSPIFLAFFMFLFSNLILISIGLFVIGTVVSLILYLEWVPLEKR